MEALLRWDTVAMHWINQGWSHPVLDFIFPLLRNKYVWIPLYVLCISWIIYNHKVRHVLMNMATSGKSLSQLRKSYPEYIMVKDKISFDPSLSPQSLLDKVADHYQSASLDTRDGLKVDFPDSWVQLRKSNTEPILRIYAEAKSQEHARNLVDEIKALL